MFDYHRVRSTAVTSARTVTEKPLARQTEHIVEQMRQEMRQLREELTEAQRAETQRVLDHVTQVEIRDRRDVLVANERVALLESAAFAASNFRGARALPTPHDTLRHALTLAPVGGMALEFGVWMGGTLRIIADARGSNEVYGFDTFTGLPVEWLGLGAGTFGLDDLPDVPGAELVQRSLRRHAAGLPRRPSRSGRLPACRL